MAIFNIIPTSLLILGLFASTTEVNQSETASLQVSQNVKVTLLSSNLADGPEVGEWGLSALVEVDGRCILFDTGRYPETVLRNAETLGIDLSCVTDVKKSFGNEMPPPSSAFMWLGECSSLAFQSRATWGTRWSRGSKGWRHSGSNSSSILSPPKFSPGFG